MEMYLLLIQSSHFVNSINGQSTFQSIHGLSNNHTEKDLL